MGERMIIVLYLLVTLTSCQSDQALPQERVNARTSVQEHKDKIAEMPTPPWVILGRIRTRYSEDSAYFLEQPTRYELLIPVPVQVRFDVNVDVWLLAVGGSLVEPDELSTEERAQNAEYRELALLSHRHQGPALQKFAFRRRREQVAGVVVRIEGDLYTLPVPRK